MNRPITETTLFPSNPIAFLDRVIIQYRGGFKHMALTIMRSGTTDPELMAAELRTRLQDKDTTLAAQALHAMDKHPDELRAWLEHLPNHDAEQAALPWDVKALRRKENARLHMRRWMAAKTPSDKQKTELARLGWEGPVPETMAECSELIDDLKRSGRR